MANILLSPPYYHLHPTSFYTSYPATAMEPGTKEVTANVEGLESSAPKCVDDVIKCVKIN